jgi:hypothetical protein
MLHRRVEIEKQDYKEGVLKIIGLGISSSGKAGGAILQSLHFQRSPLNKF